MNSMEPGKWCLIQITHDDDGEYPMASIPIAWADVVAENERLRLAVREIMVEVRKLHDVVMFEPGETARPDNYLMTFSRTDILDVIDQTMTKARLTWADAEEADE